jgi:RNA recognition motif-containing protein
MGRGEESNVVYVGGLKFSTDSDALREYFSSYGKVLGARVRRVASRPRRARGDRMDRTAPPSRFLRRHRPAAPPPSDRSIDRSEEKKFIDPLSIDDLLDRSSRDRPDVAR